MTLRSLNSMQRLMRCWRELHPYNAIEVVEVAGRPEPAVAAATVASALAAATAAVLDGLGMSRVEVTGSRCRMEAGAVDVPVEVHPGGSLDDVVTAEMNRPFPEGPAFPLRLFVLPSGGTHHVGFVVDHWALDGRSLALLASRILAHGGGGPAPPRAIAARVPTVLAAFGPRALPLAPILAARSVARLLGLRHAWSPRPHDPGDLAVDVETLDPPGDLLGGLRSASKARGLSIGTLLTLLLADALDGPTRGERTGRRRHLSIGVIADLTRLSPRLAARQPLGVFLGHDTVLVRDGVPERARRGPLASLAEIWLAQALWPFVLPAERPRYHAKHLVLSAGLSNLKLPESSIEPLAGTVRAWRGFSPAGPIVGLVLRATTAGGRIAVTLTWRRNAYVGAQREAIRAAIVERLATLSAASG